MLSKLFILFFFLYLQIQPQKAPWPQKFHDGQRSGRSYDRFESDFKLTQLWYKSYSPYAIDGHLLSPNTETIFYDNKLISKYDGHVIQNMNHYTSNENNEYLFDVTGKYLFLIWNNVNNNRYSIEAYVYNESKLYQSIWTLNLTCPSYSDCHFVALTDRNEDYLYINYVNDQNVKISNVVDCLYMQNGTIKWRRETTIQQTRMISTYPKLLQSPDGSIVSFALNGIYVIETITGNVRWNITNYNGYEPVLITNKGYIIADNQSITYAFDSKGNLKWSINQTFPSVVLSPDSEVLYAVDYKNLSIIAINTATGTVYSRSKRYYINNYHGPGILLSLNNGLLHQSIEGIYFFPYNIMIGNFSNGWVELTKKKIMT